jgi:glyoxylase-like metal-dependent hydrolase (beta-lactamase superfamily II)
LFGQRSTFFEAIIAEDNQVFEIGKIKIKVLHTPGHTMESSTFDRRKRQRHCNFLGDTLFLGDVGRPDFKKQQILLKKN